jgi:secreted PhoX family phosphatase
VKDDDPISNNSGNRPFEDVLRVNLDRRKLLKGSVATAVGAALLGPTGMAQAFPGRGRRSGGPLLGFTPVTLAEGGGPEPAISPDYDYDVILPWGDPLEPGGPGFSVTVDPTDPAKMAEQAENQTKQVGIGHDGMTFFPIRGPKHRRYGWDEDVEMDPWHGRAMRQGTGNSHGVLCMNCEFGNNFHVLRKGAPESLADVRMSQHAHGVTITELKRFPGRNGKWRTVKSDLARRIHVNTPVTFSGPVADHELMKNKAGNVPLGTVNNCANGYTPWGTYLTCEENFHGYFGANDSGFVPTDRQARYGLSRNSGYGWFRFDQRFDLSDPDYENECHRFGWVVEIDPWDPNQKPVKRTALGRKKNEGAITHVARDGRVVVYNGDDERFDYIYKFVSAEPWKTMRANGESPLDRGTLYVAKFNDDNTGEWLELSMNNPAIAAEFSDLGEMLIHTRIAADLAGATPMDRPEWATVAPDGRVYFALTNNSQRNDSGPKEQHPGRVIDTGPNAANPLAPNADGHIIRWTETGGHTGTTFEWDIFVFAKDTHGTEESFADPDGLWADPDGRLFIETDGGQKDGLQNQILVADTDTGEIRRLFTGPPGCEITGLTMTPDRRTMFINVQHPGNGNPASTSWPSPTGSGEVPRDATVVITRKDGGIVGS